MRVHFILFIISFISFNSYSQGRKIGTVTDSINFSTIIVGSDSFLYFIGNKGMQHHIVLKTTQQLDTIWSKTFSADYSSSFPNAIYSNYSNQLLINCSGNLLVKMDSSGTINSIKEIDVSGSSYFRITSTLEKNDSLLFTMIMYDNTGHHNGIAVADTSGNIGSFHDNVGQWVNKIMNFRGGYFLSPSCLVMDTSFNVLEQYSITSTSSYFTYYMGESIVLNDTSIVGSVIVYNPWTPEADEIFKITQSGLQWVVKDDLITGDPAFEITPAKIYPNGNIACVMSSGSDIFTGLIDANGSPIGSNRMNVVPDSYNSKIGVCDLSNGFAFAYGNVIGIADSSGATCFSNSGTMDQYTPVSSMAGAAGFPDSMYTVNWNINSLVDTTTQANFEIDLVCTSVQVEDFSAENNLTIYPNPWSDYFQVSGLKQLPCKLVVTDISGKIVFETVVENPGRISVPRNLARGFYLIEIEGLPKSLRTVKLD